MANKRGIITQATGSHYYGELAFNLALSLKYNEAECELALVYDRGAISTLTERELALFDYLIEVRPEDLVIDGKPCHFKPKTLLGYYSPFERSIWLDADTIWIPNRRPSWVFGELEGKGFTIANNGMYDVKTGKSSGQNYLYWGDPAKIAKHYKIKDFIPQTNSTFIYWENDERTARLLEEVRKVYDTPADIRQKNDWGFADEFAYNVAMGMLKIYPHKTPYRPVYISFLNASTDKDYISANYWALTNAGNRTHPTVAKIYNRYVDYYYNILGLSERRYHRDKKDVVDGRKKM